MAVRPLRDGRYVVETDSGTYVVDLEERTCTCPDHAIRGSRCKHLRRVGAELVVGLVPPPGMRDAVCAVCGDRTLVARETSGPALCADHRLAPGDLVRDRETDKLLLVVRATDRRADEAVVEGAGRTVAAFASNADYGDHEPVVEAVYLDSLRPADDPASLRRYGFPASRLRPLTRTHRDRPDERYADLAR
jgi:hypothetical protein